jgi:hypothetical protein
MPDQSAPTTLEQFLLRYVATHDQVAILLWLRAHDEEPVSRRELALQLGFSDARTSEALRRLAASELIVSADSEADSFKYVPRRPLENYVRLLAHVRSRDPGCLDRMLARNALRRLGVYGVRPRAPVVQAYAR